MMPELSKEDREKALSSAYNAASQTLRDRHRDEFNDLYATEAKERGVEWKPRLKAEERAEQTLLSIFDEFPALRAQYAPSPGEDEPSP